MALDFLQDQPISSPVVRLAYPYTLSSGEVSIVRILIESVSTIASPATYISDNSLEAEVLSKAGLDDDITFASYELSTSEQSDGLYVYVIDATVS